MYIKSIQISVITLHVTHCQVTQLLEKILIILCFADSHKTHIIDSSAKKVSGCVFALDLLILGTNCAKNRECSLDIVAQETIIWNVTGNSSLYLNLMRTPILKAIFG